MTRARIPPVSDNPGPHGVAVGYDCAGCGRHDSRYPPNPPKGWVLEDGKAYCKRCSPVGYVCVECGTVRLQPPTSWVKHEGEWYCGPCADRPRRAAR